MSARRPKRDVAGALDFHPTVQTNVDAGRLVAPLSRVLGWGIMVISFTAASVFAYTSVIGRIDRLDDRMTQQGRSLESLVQSVAKIANEALVPQDLQTFCLKAQLSNPNWKCPPPYSTDGPVEVKRAPSLPRPAPKPEKAKASSGSFPWPFTSN